MSVCVVRWIPAICSEKTSLITLSIVGHILYALCLCSVSELKDDLMVPHSVWTYWELCFLLPSS